MKLTTHILGTSSLLRVSYNRNQLVKRYIYCVLKIFNPLKIKLQGFQHPILHHVLIDYNGLGQSEKVNYQRVG